MNLVDKLPDEMNMPQFEVNNAGLAVAWVCGAVPGFIAGKLDASAN